MPCSSDGSTPGSRRRSPRSPAACRPPLAPTTSTNRPSKTACSSSAAISSPRPALGSRAPIPRGGIRARSSTSRTATTGKAGAASIRTTTCTGRELKPSTARSHSLQADGSWSTIHPADPHGRRTESRTGQRHAPGRIRSEPAAHFPRAQMTPAREAVYLPLMALTVALLGGLRIGAPVVLLPPPLFALVLGLLLMGVL